MPEKIRDTDTGEAPWDDGTTARRRVFIPAYADAVNV
jgi:hypothetical protein